MLHFVHKSALWIIDGLSRPVLEFSGSSFCGSLCCSGVRRSKLHTHEAGRLTSTKELDTLPAFT